MITIARKVYHCAAVELGVQHMNFKNSIGLSGNMHGQLCIEHIQSSVDKLSFVMDDISLAL